MGTHYGYQYYSVKELNSIFRSPKPPHIREAFIPSLTRRVREDLPLTEQYYHGYYSSESSLKTNFFVFY
jgi:hypothetical protein